MRRLFTAVMMLSVCCGYGAGIKAGNARLRELVVYPTINLAIGYQLFDSRQGFLEDYLVPGEIERLRKETKEHPDDLESLLNLARLLDRSGLPDDATSCFEQAEKAARKKCDVRPQDGLARVYLGQALDWLDREEEAESFFRKATLLSSNEWQCWAGLGSFLADRSVYTLLPPDKTNFTANASDALMAAAADFHPSADLLARAEKMREESERCYDRAIALAPKEPDVFLGRALAQVSIGTEELLIRYYHGRVMPDANELTLVNYSREVVDDLQKAAQLCPDDERILGITAGYEYTCAAAEALKQRAAGESLSLKDLPESVQTSVHGTMGHLRTLSQSADKERASGALEQLGFIKITSDDASAKEDLRRAVALEPRRDKAWELSLCAAIKFGAPPEEMASICESRLKFDNSARNHLLLAKALVKQNRFEDASAQVKTAMELEPDNIAAHLFAAALELAHGKDEESLSVAGQEFLKVNELRGKLLNDEYRPRLREYMLDGAIYYALTDKSAQAKKWVNEVLGQYPDDQTAKDILSAIE